GVLDRVENSRVLGEVLRIEDALEGILEIVRVAGFAIGPLGAAKIEGPGAAVLAGLPALGHTGDGFGFGVLGGEADEHVADDIVLPLTRGLVGIERERFALVADVERALGLIEADNLAIG